MAFWPVKPPDSARAFASFSFWGSKLGTGVAMYSGMFLAKRSEGKGP
jgi:hypothetical protein